MELPDKEYRECPEDPIEIEIGDVFDLHTVPARDVGPIVEAYLEEAYSRGFRHLRIIHGKGIGRQREIVRGILAKTSFVTHFEDAPMEAGGWGATVVDLLPGTRKTECGAASS